MQDNTTRMSDEEFERQAAILRPALIGIAQRYTGSNVSAEDIVQESLLKMWTMRDRLHMPVDAFARVLTRNLAIDYCRQQPSACTAPDLLQTVTDSSDTRQAAERMMGVVATLPDTWQTVLKMRHIDGMEYSDIAMAMHSTETAVRKLVSRARTAVRNGYMKNRTQHDDI